MKLTNLFNTDSKDMHIKKSFRTPKDNSNEYEISHSKPGKYDSKVKVFKKYLQINQTFIQEGRIFQ